MNRTVPSFYPYLLVGFYIVYKLGTWGWHWLWMWVFFGAFSYVEMRKRVKFYKETRRLEDQAARYQLAAEAGESESVKWLNSIIGKFLKKYNASLEEYLIEMMDLTIDYYRPPQINSIKFTKFNLGMIPPHLNGIRMYRTISPDKIQFDADICADGDMTIELAIKFGMLKFPIRVQDIVIKGKLRIQLDLIDSFPWAGVAHLSFLKKPVIDLNLVPLGAVDIMDVPVVSNFLHSFLTDTIVWLMVLPAKLSIDLTGGVAVKRPLILKAQLIGARDLEAADRGGTSDPYALVALGDQKHKTPVIKKTCNPTWNEDFTFTVVDSNVESLTVEIYDKDMIGADGNLGSCTVLLDRLEPLIPVTSWYKLRNAKTGEVQLTLTLFDPNIQHEGDADSISLAQAPGVVRGYLVEGKDLLKAKRFAGSRDPYATLTVGKSKHVSQVQYGTTDPQWNEWFELYVDNPTTDKIDVAIADKDRFTKDNPLGDCFIDVATLGANEDKDIWIPLRNVSGGGQIHFKIRFEPLVATSPSATSTATAATADEPSTPKKEAPATATTNATTTTTTVTTPPATTTSSDTPAKSPVAADTPVKDAKDPQVEAKVEAIMKEEGAPTASPVTTASATTSPASSARPSMDSRAAPPSPSTPAQERGAPTPLYTPRDPTATEGLAKGDSFTMNIVEAKDLEAKDRNGLSDPYVSIRMPGADKRRTKTIKKTLAPMWNDSHEYKITKDPKEPIVLVVKDEDKLWRNTEIGSLSIRPMDIPKTATPWDKWIPLDSSNGKLHVVITPTL